MALALSGMPRVSTQDQDLALQIDALLKYGVAKELIFTDKALGAQSTKRPGLDTCLAQLRDGGCLACLATGSAWPIGATPRDGLIDELRDRHIGFRSVCDGRD